MDPCTPNSCCRHWQATLPSILRCIKEKFELANTTKVMNHQPVQKKLTSEAIFVLCLILLFVILTLIRSLMSIYERFNSPGKEKNSLTVKRKVKARDGDTHTEETSSNSVSLNNLTSFLDCFCIQSNSRRLLSTASTEKQLSCLHGIRGLLVIWAISGHVGSFYAISVKNREELAVILSFQGAQIFNNAAFLIDAFLVLSGFLNGYLFSQHYEKTNGKISWLSYYVHRFVRISPLYFLVLGFYTFLFPHLGSGPIWPTYDTNPVCREVWLSHVLFINNYNWHTKQCLISTWNLACEMQLYIISPIFLILLMRRPKMGYFLIFIGVFFSCFLNFHVTKQYNLVDDFARVGDYYTGDLKYFLSRCWKNFDLLYSKAYARLGVFLFGMALGCYLFQKKKTQIKRSNVLTLSMGWIMAAIFYWISIFALYGREESPMEIAVYNGLRHLVFSCSVGWVIFACVTGQGGFVNRFLSTKIFIVISRLSYMIYLTHMIMLEGYFLSLDDQLEHSIQSMVLHTLLALLIFPASFVLSVIFEAPLVRMISLFYRKSNQEMKAYKQE